ncbi:MAG TPA: hypothetical protein VE465_09830 [Streptosporangiaceae bacterium]|nr:hypothetical protein [Streptosporangiaceae bacterium]
MTKRRFSEWARAVEVPDGQAAQYGFQAEGEAAFQDAVSPWPVKPA